MVGNQKIRMLIGMLRIKTAYVPDGKKDSKGIGLEDMYATF